MVDRTRGVKTGTGMVETSLSGFHTPKTDNQNLIYKVGWLFEKNIEPLVIPLHPTTDIVL